MSKKHIAIAEQIRIQIDSLSAWAPIRHPGAARMTIVETAHRLCDVRPRTLPGRVWHQPIAHYATTTRPRMLMKKLRITIGTGCGLRKDGSRISLADRMRMIMRTKQMMLSSCGGYTMLGADGGWRDADSKDWEEPNLQFVTTIEPGAVTPEALAALVRDTFEQVCVMLTVEEVNTKFI